MTLDQKLDRIERLCDRQHQVSLEIIEQIKGNERKNIIGIEPSLKKLTEDVHELKKEREARKIRADYTASIFKWTTIVVGVVGGIIGILKFIL